MQQVQSIPSERTRWDMSGGGEHHASTQGLHYSLTNAIKHLLNFYSSEIHLLKPLTSVPNENWLCPCRPGRRAFIVDSCIAAVEKG